MTMRFRSIILTAVVAASAVGAGVARTGAVSADTQICDQYGTTAVGNYIAMNNNWGSSATQCINVTDSGFTISQHDGKGEGLPTGYPALYLGCHGGTCSPNSPIPAQIGGLKTATSSISFQYPNNMTTEDLWTSAYDIWLDPAPKKDGKNQTEIMIWFDYNAGQPVGSSVGSATVGDRSWTVWTGNNGENDVVTYVASSTMTSWDFSVLDFVKDTINRGYATPSWYLTSVQGDWLGLPWGPVFGQAEAPRGLVERGVWGARVGGGSGGGGDPGGNAVLFGGFAGPRAPLVIVTLRDRTVVA